jgi:hypothetical protein
MQMMPQEVSTAIQTLDLTKDETIDAPIAIVWESMLEELGPLGDHPQGGPMPMVLEAFPGGRWFRDTGNNSGHLWGHVQVIKPPKLLEICGPMFMSYPAISHVQYRLEAQGAGTRLTLKHRAIGLLDPEHMKGVSTGWQYKLDKIRERAGRRVKAL